MNSKEFNEWRAKTAKEIEDKFGDGTGTPKQAILFLAANNDGEGEQLHVDCLGYWASDDADVLIAALADSMVRFPQLYYAVKFALKGAEGMRREYFDNAKNN